MERIFSKADAINVPNYADRSSEPLKPGVALLQ